MAKVSVKRNSQIIDGITLGFSTALLLAALAGCVYTRSFRNLPADFFHILTTPGPLVTDYFRIGSLPAAFLNAALCGYVMAAFMIFLPGPSHVNTLAGYFLVIAHCFYGLNFLNMWPCFLAPFLYLRMRRLDFNENLHVCMFATCFSPFISELLFRYTLGDRFVAGEVQVTLKGVLLLIPFILIIAFIALSNVHSWIYTRLRR